MKNLLFVFLLALPMAHLYAQGLTDDGKDISIKLTGGKPWDKTEFHIDIEKKGQSVFIKYDIKEEFNFAEIRKDSIYQKLMAKYKNVSFKSKEQQILSAMLLKKMDQYRPTYQDSITVDIKRYMMYKPLLNNLAVANKKLFDGNYPVGMFDFDFLFCDITYNGRTRRFDKMRPYPYPAPCCTPY